MTEWTLKHYKDTVYDHIVTSKPTPVKLQSVLTTDQTCNAEGEKSLLRTDTEVNSRGDNDTFFHFTKPFV